MCIIVFEPKSACDEHGEFLMSATRCIGCLEKQIESYGIAADAMLLEWIAEHSAGASLVVPDKYDDRTRYVVTELLEDNGACTVKCKKCNKLIQASELRREGWDDSSVEQGIRVGSSGYKIVCNDGHDLLVVCTRIY